MTSKPRPYRIEYRGESGRDAYVVGNLAAAILDSEIEWSRVIPRPTGGFHAFGGYSTPGPPDSNDALVLDFASDYWGNGATAEEALRFLHGAALDPREGE